MESNVPKTAEQEILARVAAGREAQRKALGETFEAIRAMMQRTTDGLVRDAFNAIAKTISELHRFNEATSHIGQLVPMPADRAARQAPPLVGPGATSADTCTACGHGHGLDVETPTWLSGERAILLAQLRLVTREEVKKGLGLELRQQLDRELKRFFPVSKFGQPVTKRRSRAGRKPIDPWFRATHDDRVARGIALPTFKAEAVTLIEIYKAKHGRGAARVPGWETVARHLSRRSKLRVN